MLSFILLHTFQFRETASFRRLKLQFRQMTIIALTLLNKYNAISFIYDKPWFWFVGSRFIFCFHICFVCFPLILPRRILNVFELYLHCSNHSYLNITIYFMQFHAMDTVSFNPKNVNNFQKTTKKKMNQTLNNYPCYINIVFQIIR